MKNIKETEMKDLKRYNEFSLRFRQAVSDRGWLKKRREDLGKIVGVTGPAVTYWWNGNRLPTIEQAIVIGEHLNICVEWLLTGRGPKHPLPCEDDCLDMSELSVDEKKIFRALLDTMKPCEKRERRKNDNIYGPFQEVGKRRRH